MEDRCLYVVDIPAENPKSWEFRPQERIMAMDHLPSKIELFQLQLEFGDMSCSII